SRHARKEAFARPPPSRGPGPARAAAPARPVAPRRALRRPRPGRGAPGGGAHPGAPRRGRRGRLHDAPALRPRCGGHARGRAGRGRRPRGRRLMLGVARAVVERDLLLALRRKSDVGIALLFFVIVTSLFPLGVGAEPNLLRAIAPGVIWVAALLASMLSLERLFAGDHADGTLEQMLLGG